MRHEIDCTFVALIGFSPGQSPVEESCQRCAGSVCAVKLELSEHNRLGLIRLGGSACQCKHGGGGQSEWCIDPDDIGSIAYLKDGKWHDAPARDADFDGITLEAWKSEFAKIARENYGEAELAQDLRAEALRSIRPSVQAKLDQLLPGSEAVDADAVQRLEATLFFNKTWKSSDTVRSDNQDDVFGTRIASNDHETPVDNDTTKGKDDSSGRELEDE